MLQLNLYNQQAVVTAALNHINQFANAMGPTLIEGSINRLGLEQLRALHSSLNAHTDDTRFKALAKQLFAQDVQAITHTKKAVDVTQKAIDLVVAVGFYMNYGSETGGLEWASYTSDIVKVLTLVRIQTPHPTP